MKMDEELGQDRDSSFLTDDEEKQSSLASSDDEDDDGNYRSSSPLSRNHSDDSPSPWPRSYRRSMDMLTGVTPPTVSFIPRSGSRTLSSNADSSFCKRRQNSCQDSFSSSASKPLISQSIHGKEEIRTSALISAIEFISSQLELSIADHPFPPENRCSFSQSVLNGVNVLCGLALLTMPYALKEGGWIGLFVLLLFGIITCYTGILLKRCAESSPGLTTYPDIGHAAFGMTGRVIISILLYLELYASCVEYIIMMSDNLSGLFPNTSLRISGLSLDSSQIFAVATTVIVLPTVWLRDLSLLSYLSVGGVLSSILLALCLLWNGSVDGVGFHLTGQALDLTNLPVSVGIFGLGFAGHSVFPNLYSSMKEPSKFPLVLVICFGFCTFLYIGVAICGYTMFGDAIQSQFTLNMPKQFLTSRIAVWTAVVTPMTKYALTITPVVLSLEELMPSSKMKPYGSSILLRTILVISTLVVALAVPFFAIVGALMGSFLAVLVALIFPCMCYLSILKGRLSNTQVGICILIIIFGLVAGCCGTYSAVARLIGELT
ncbi:PREDICTED: vacuolar amino acid transporter 1-like isoform X1 [Tarenaya hassleriana]|uniref:vacuolar amino acid transporter 1-like isoform X1 n=1 Tax=Tarenaya hassleriana TaxID=28532 RepID=UPI00053C3EEC|nr:PREDICTED: vacuolar amino acid transporter 1-like isoform X1 [Tarenaya hassleriana]